MNARADLAARLGVATEYIDAWGERRQVPDATIAQVIRTMGESVHDVAASPVLIIRDDEKTIALPMVAHAWTIKFEDPSRAPLSGAIAKGRIKLSRPLPMGYHTLILDDGEIPLIVAPRTCYQPPAFGQGHRRWGLSVQLYAVRSLRNWGIGDFTDLANILRLAARQGAACVGLNPLHALFPATPEDASPYSPNSRLFLNTLYIDVEAMEDYRDFGGDIGFMSAPDFKAELEALRAAPAVDYTRVAACKHRAFRALYRNFRDVVLTDEHAPRTIAFRAFQQERGETLRAFAAHADPAHAEYHAYLQWQASQQLTRAQDVARRLGMSIGVYQDLAVGMSPSGAEAAANRDVLAPGFSVGAPPDLLNMKGQNWGLPPLDPHLLRRRAYAPLRELLRANMRGNGALRIDHILGFMRLFWIPTGAPTSDGAYVAYPWRDMLAILALESQRNRCLVIGEDLGTVPDDLRTQLRAAGVFSTLVFYFEKGAPEDYPSEALLAVSTHDLPTLTAYWSRADLALRTQLDLWPSAEARIQAETERTQDLRGLRQLLNLTSDHAHAPIGELYGRLARAPTRLLMVQLEDVAGQEAQMNVPGTYLEYPNWRVRQARDIDDLLAGETFAAIARALDERTDRPRPQPRGSGDFIATYRLQFSEEFTFDDAARIAPYLAALGVSHVYASPWMTARPHTTHGYDVTDHNAVSPAFGGESGLDNMMHALKDNGLGHILDFVPNHMGIGPANPLWMDVLSRGRASRYAAWFDINWRTDAHLKDKVLLPILGEHYGDALAQGKLRLRFDALNQRYNIWYGQYRLPLRDDTDPALVDAAAHDDAKALHSVLEQQHYHVAYWAAASDEINYRRFFNINDLAGLRMERRGLFNHAHSLIARLVEQGTLDGLRIDHIDGLYDPAGYCAQLSALVAEKRPGPFPILVEKILARHERLRAEWPIAGTTGYEFLAQVSGLLVDSRSEAAFNGLYASLSRDQADFAEVLHRSKVLVLDSTFRPELRVLSHRLHRLARSHWRSRDYTRDILRLALREIVIHFPVYRTYVGDDIAAEDRRDIDWAVAQARKTWRAPAGEILDFVTGVITGDLARSDSGYDPAAVLRFARRFQQFTSPIMAKSLEDTAFYRYVRLAALNEVGGDPRQYGVSANAVHRFNAERTARPLTLNATATHDTKRGEDTRARMLALSELPKSWAHEVKRWGVLNARHKTHRDEAVWPDANDEYLLYQTLIGAWPGASSPEFTARIIAYMTKAMREAKRHTSWDNPDAAYEAAVTHFVTRILDRAWSRAFLDRFGKFQARVARLGVCNSLAQLVIKMCAPGLPDIYQGTELWDFSLVDPDNRHPVDYALRQRLLFAEPALESVADGIKFAVTRALLALRRERIDVFTAGDYTPLAASGRQAGHVFAFSRRAEGRTVIAAVTLQSGSLTDGNAILPSAEAWSDTLIEIPLGSWRDVLSGRTIAGGPVAMRDLFARLPVAVLS